MTDPNDLIFQATAFAARAHRHQLRKDQQTPYVSHVYRVCFVVRQVFGFDDPHMLATALLHDTLEDTTTDFDDLLERFGPDIARWVAVLTKDMRLEDARREEAYVQALAMADWQVQVIKLADVYDNINDSQNLSPSARQKTARRSRSYLDAVKPKLLPLVEHVIEALEKKLQEVELGMTS